MSSRQRKPAHDDAAPDRPDASPRRRGIVHDTSVLDEPGLSRIASVDGLFVTDDRQRIVNWSSSAQRMLGYSPEEVVGQPCYLVLMGREPDGHPVCRRQCSVTRNARRGRGTPAYPVAARARDGSVRSVTNSVLVVDDTSGGFRVLHMIRDTGPAPVERRPPPRPQPPDDPVETPSPEALTRRELEVLRLFAQAATIDDVAAALSISVFTARNHIARVQQKLGARNRLEMVLVGLRRGLI